MAELLRAGCHSTTVEALKDLLDKTELKFRKIDNVLKAYACLCCHCYRHWWLRRIHELHVTVGCILCYTKNIILGDGPTWLKSGQVPQLNKSSSFTNRDGATVSAPSALCHHFHRQPFMRWSWLPGLLCLPLLRQHLASGTVCHLICPMVSLGSHLRHFFLGSRATAQCNLR